MRNEQCAGCSYHAAAQQYQADRSQHVTQSMLPNGDFIVALDPQVDEAVDAALELCEQGQTDTAWAQVTRLLRAHPENHSVCYAMGVLQGFKNEHKEAIRWFDKAIAIYPLFVEAHFNKAVSHQKQLQLAGAVNAYKKVVALGDPNDVAAQRAQTFLKDMAATIRRNDGVSLDTYLESQAMFDQAYALMEQGNWSAATLGFQASAAKHDRNAPTHGNLGLCLSGLGHKQQALAELDRALEIDPQYEPASANRAVIEHMEEGVPLSGTFFMPVDFGKDKFLAGQRDKLGNCQPG
jgi:tetratricopeptide (TPR) repeat protein